MPNGRRSSSSAIASRPCSTVHPRRHRERRDRHRRAPAPRSAAVVELYPAIDIEAAVVLLSQGEATRQTVYGEDPPRSRRPSSPPARAGSTWWIWTALRRRRQRIRAASRDRAGRGSGPDPGGRRVPHPRAGAAGRGARHLRTSCGPRRRSIRTFPTVAAEVPTRWIAAGSTRATAESPRGAGPRPRRSRPSSSPMRVGAGPHADLHRRRDAHARGRM